MRAGSGRVVDDVPRLDLVVLLHDALGIDAAGSAAGDADLGAGVHVLLHDAAGRRVQDDEAARDRLVFVHLQVRHEDRTLVQIRRVRPLVQVLDVVPLEDAFEHHPRGLAVGR